MKTSHKAFTGVALVAALACLPWLLSTPYTLHLITIALFWVLLAQGLNIVQGEAGYVSIATAGFMGVGAYGSALLVQRLGFPVWGAMAVAPLLSAALAFVVGYPTLRVKGHYFAIITLAYNLVIFIIAMNAHFTGGEGGLTSIPRPEPVFGISFEDRNHYYLLALFVASLGCVGAYFISRSRLGVVLRAIRQNENLAEGVGVTTRHYKLAAFTLSALYAGAAGALYAHFIGFINPTPFAPDSSLNAILAVIVGGSGTVAGPAVGAFIVTFLPEFLRIDENMRFIAYGLILILSTIYLPRGLLPLLATGWRKLQGRHRQVPLKTRAAGSAS